jgi:hypothetical protein
MANWAIVIGIDDYWAPQFRLKSCVNDAVKITQWLLDPRGGNVPPQNLYLLTRPTPPPPDLGPIPGSVQRKDATFDLLVTETDNLITRSGGKGERFFFYFSGHGITNTSGIDAEEALVMADFTDTLTHKAVEPASIIEFFKATAFRQQFFIVDACRDVPDWKGKFRTSPFTPVGTIDDNAPQVHQYTLVATSPRSRAVAIGDQSAFTEELLKGLKGKGTAIVVDTKTREYVVKTSYLFKFVETQIAKRKINVSNDPNKPFYQMPRINGEHGSEDPELARLKKDEVDKAELKVFVKPDLAWPYAALSVVDQFGKPPQAPIKPITGAPISLQLLPMIYTVRAEAPGYEPEEESWSVDLYDTSELPVQLIPSTNFTFSGDVYRAGGDVNIAGGAFHTGGIVSTKGLGQPPGKPPSLTATLTVRASDSLAPLELADSQGKVLLAGYGKITDSELEPGFYRARLFTPEGQVIEKLVSLESNAQEEVFFDSSELPTSAIVDELGEPQFAHNDEAADFAKKVGLMATPQLSTILAVAGSEVNQDQDSNRYRDFGIRSFKETVPGKMSGVQILSGSEGVERNSSRLSNMKVRLWRIGEAETDTAGELTQTGPLGFYEFSQASEPGHYFLSVGVAEEEPAVFAIAILSHRLAMLVLQYDASGSLRVFQYNLSLTSQSEDYKRLSPDQVRWLELAQRFYLSGRLDYAFETGVKLLYDKWADPLAGCLGSYLLLRRGEPGELSIAANNMVSFYGDLCDSHILKGEYEAYLGNEGVAKSAFKRALDLGVPVFAEGLTRLGAAIQKYQFQDHPNAEWISKVDSKRVRGYLWTAWRPSKEVTPHEIVIVPGAGGITIAGRDIYKAGGDMNFANRDVVNVAGNFSQFQQPAEQGSSVPRIFSELAELSRSSLDADVEMVQGIIDKLKTSVTSIQQGDEGANASRILATRLKALLDVQRDVGELALERLSDPEAQVSSRIREVAREVQSARLDG